MHSHKYVGANASIWCKHVTNPLCNYLVELLPEWIAPNIITFIGLQMTLVPAVWMVYQYGYEFDGPISGLMCFVVGVAYKSYNIIDKIDGK